MNTQVTKKFTESIASLYQLKNQFENKDVPNRESRGIDMKNYGSIKRTQNNSGTYVTLNPYGNNQGSRTSRFNEECEIREKFELDFEAL